MSSSVFLECNCNASPSLPQLFSSVSPNNHFYPSCILLLLLLLIYDLLLATQASSSSVYMILDIFYLDLLLSSLLFSAAVAPYIVESKELSRL
ncbi:hypothetical protein QL285_029363 [Trifolium repens]|nr:hypothetical protein QL285_029363 [Trifolium repens]